MTQGLNQIGNLGNRCSERKSRLRIDRIPLFIPRTDLWTTSEYSFKDSSGIIQRGEMGDTMAVLLLPRAFDQIGTAPGGNELEPISTFLLDKYRGENFIKGHMWNQEFGGRGETYNFVPLTYRANSVP